MVRKTCPAKTAGHRKRIVKTAEMTVLRRLKQLNPPKKGRVHLKAQNWALRMNNLVAENSASKCLRG